MKLLVLYQARDVVKDHPGYFAGFRQLVTEGALSEHVAIPYYGIAESRGWASLWAEAYDTARAIDADAIFLQFFHGPIPDPTDGIQRLKQLSNRPLIFTSLGDPYGRWTKRVPISYRIASSLADVNFLTGMGYLARQLVDWGSKNLVLMPHGSCQVRFGSPVTGGSNPEFDVVFVGNRIRSRNPLSHFYWVGKTREDLVAAFSKRYGRRFGLFGKGWADNDSWRGPVPYLEQHSTYRRSAVVLGGMPNAYYDYYQSDRPFIAVSSGIPLVDYWVPGIDAVLKPERDWWLGRSIGGLLHSCDRVLAIPESDRLALGGEARLRVLSAHTQYHRCRDMVQIVQAIRTARLAGKRAPKPSLRFLAANPANEQNAPEPIVGWVG